MKLANAIICKSILSKARGQMFRLKPKNMVFVFDKLQKVSLHMLFVFFPIDVVFLDSEFRVIEIKENFRPLSFYTPKLKAKYVVEVPAGFVNEKKIIIGSLVLF